jgi:hypothetical protein
MLPLIPWLFMSFASALGWKLGKPFGVFAAAVFSIVGAALGFYYGRKLRRAVTP